MPPDLASPGAIIQHFLDPVGAVLEVVQLDDLMLPAVLDEQAPSESLDQRLRRSLRSRWLVDEDAGRLSHLDRAQGRVLERMVVHCSGRGREALGGPRYTKPGIWES